MCVINMMLCEGLPFVPDTTDIDIWNWRTPGGARVDRERDGAIFAEALRGASLLAICFGAAVWTLYRRLVWQGKTCSVSEGSRGMPFFASECCMAMFLETHRLLCYDAV
jgi:hypothetical protein